jgi:hypothetical protein
VEGDGGLGPGGVHLPQGAGGHLLAPPQGGQAKGQVAGAGLRPGGGHLPQCAGGHPLAPLQGGQAKGQVAGAGLGPGGGHLPQGAEQINMMYISREKRGDGFSRCSGSSALPPLLDPGPQGRVEEGEVGEGWDPSSAPSTPATSPP